MGMRVVTFDEFVNLSIADSSDSLVRKRPKNECSFLIKNNMYNLYFLFYKKRSNQLMHVSTFHINALRFIF